MSDNISAQTGHFKTKDGVELFTRAWEPSAPRAYIAHVHGIAEHSGRYEPVATYLAQQGFAWHSYDHRGHGQSPGERAYLPSTDVLLADVDAFLAHVRAAATGKPLFLMGHSMGGGEATLYVIESRPAITGLVLTAPMVKLGADATPLIQLVARILSKIAPKTGVTALSSESISRDPAVRQDYDNDPLNFRGSLPARTGAVLIEIVKRAQAGLDTIGVPFLTMHGTADKLTEVSGSQMLYDQAASQDKTVEFYDGLYHEIMNEPEKAQVWSDIAAWLTAHVDQG